MLVISRELSVVVDVALTTSRKTIKTNDFRFIFGETCMAVGESEEKEKWSKM